MSDFFRTIKATSQGLYKEKMSKFISFAVPVQSADEAKAVIKQYQNEYHDARHVCWAYMIGTDRSEFLSNDNGEPSGTAGKPILDVLRANRLTDCVVTVTRYFGGILLGSGGLTRAYSSAASLAVKAADTARIATCVRLRMTAGYPQLDTLTHLIAQSDGVRDNEQYTDVVRLDALIEQSKAQAFSARVVEAFSRSVHAERIGVEHRAIQ